MDKSIEKYLKKVKENLTLCEKLDNMGIAYNLIPCVDRENSCVSRPISVKTAEPVQGELELVPIEERTVHERGASDTDINSFVSKVNSDLPSLNQSRLTINDSTSSARLFKLIVDACNLVNGLRVTNPAELLSPADQRIDSTISQIEGFEEKISELTNVIERNNREFDAWAVKLTKQWVPPKYTVDVVPPDEDIYQFQLDIDTVPHIVRFIATQEINKYYDMFNLSRREYLTNNRYDDAMKVIE